MKTVYSEPLVSLYCGDCRDVLAALPENSVDTVITDPPYELGFMGKSWDSSGVAFRPETWAAVLRVAKPGAMLLAFGGSRTFHRLTCAIEDAGWEIRDCMSWLYGSGFPKSLDISKAMDKAAGVEREVVGKNPNIRHGEPLRYRGQNARPNLVGADRPLTAPASDLARQWNGWGTALKPAWEPIVVAMKPLDGTFAENAQAWGVAGLNIDGGRIGTNGETFRAPQSDPANRVGAVGRKAFVTQKSADAMKAAQRASIERTASLGRWPANVVLDEVAAAALDEQTGDVSGGDARGFVGGSREGGFANVGAAGGDGRPCGQLYADTGGASRFFYTAKASRSDRGASNTHPTVKPTELLKYLCKLTATPTGGVVLDPFVGSGTTLVAARDMGRPCIGIDLEADHCRIVIDRLRQGVLWGVA